MQRAVLVGCGAMSRTWLEAARAIDDLSIVGLVDVNPEQACNRAEEFALADATIGTDLAVTLKALRPDLVFDVVVPSARHAVVSTALDAGCHVLSEKPLADTMDEARDLLRRAETAGRLHVVVQNRRYIEQVRRIRRFLDTGAIGTVTSLHADFFLGPHFGGFREEMAHVLLLDMAIHTIDAARYLAAGEGASVYAEEWQPQNSWYREGSSAAAIFRFASGAMFTYRGSWCAEGLGTSWESAWRVVGTGGSLTWDGHDAIRAEVVCTDQPSEFFSKTDTVDVPAYEAGKPEAPRIGGHRGVLEDFMAAVRGGPEPETVSSENIKSLAMVFGAIESAEAGRRIDIVI